MAFWRMIKEGHDHFMVTKAEPKVDVCDKRYVFDAEPAPGMSFRPKDKCPTYTVPAEIAAAVKEKSDKDERDFTALANKGIATVAVRTGTDGGMHPTFLAKLRPQDALFDNDGHFRPVMPSSIPLPANVNPPRAPSPEAETTSSIAAAQPEPAAPAKPKPTMALAGTSKPTVSASLAPPASPSKPAPTIHAVTKPKPAPATPQPQPEVAQMSAPPAKLTPPAASPFPNPPPAASSGVMTGATPVVPSGTFESRWGGMR
jgi:hypothetical protein